MHLERSWRMIAAVRYSHMQKKLMALGAPTCTVMDRILEKEKDDISLKKLTELLKVVPENGTNGSSTSSDMGAVDKNTIMEVDDK
jgi:hypothetical protein